MGGAGGDLFAGALRNGSSHDGPCDAAADCKKASGFAAVEVGTPGHGYADVVRASRYAWASAGYCGRKTVAITKVHRTNVRHPRKDSGGPWHAFMLGAAFPGAIPVQHVTWPRDLYDNTRQGEYPMKPNGGEAMCCPACVAAGHPSGSSFESLVSPWRAFRQPAMDWLQCSLWHQTGLALRHCGSDGSSGGGGGGGSDRKDLASDEAPGASPTTLSVLVVSRKGFKRAFGSDAELASLVEGEPSLGAKGGWAGAPGVRAVSLETKSAQEQCVEVSGGSRVFFFFNKADSVSR
jgi:hypothetical protein